MLDIKFIRAFPEKVKETVVARKAKKVDVDEILRMDSMRLDLLKDVETKRALRNSLNDAIKRADASEKKKILEEATVLKTELKKLEDDLKIIEGSLEEKLLYVPNFLADDVPPGTGDPDHKELAVWIPGQGYLSKEHLGLGDNAMRFMPTPSFTGQDHVEIGKKLDIIDVEQSAKVAGSRFCYLKKDAVLLQDAFMALLKKKLIQEGFIPMITPLMVRERVLFGTSHFPEGRDQVYKIDTEFLEENAQLYLVGSSEPPLFAYHMDKVLELKGPHKMYALTSCFRSEVGSWGKDVRGVKRVHQFDKLEIDVVCEPKDSMEVMEYLRGINEWFYQTLELPYRVIYKCAGDCGYNASHKQYDVEVWLPHQKEFIEVASDTNTLDYQARRMNIKYKNPNGDSGYVHTVNDTGCPAGRVLIAIIDNYQQENGTIRVPKALQEFMGKEVIS